MPDVSLVVNVTFPLNVGASPPAPPRACRLPPPADPPLPPDPAEDYVHRIGRAGRGGKNGKAITFFTGIKHEKTLAGPFIKVLLEAGAAVPKEMNRFPKNIVSQREVRRLPSLSYFSLGRRR